MQHPPGDGVDTSNSRRVLIADGDPNVRSALGLLLTREPGLTLVGQTCGFEDLLHCVEQTQPHLVLVDWELPGMAPLQVVPALKARRPDVRLIALSTRSELREHALAAGADAFVCKSDGPASLLATLRLLTGAGH